MTQPRRCLMHFHVPGSAWFICYRCTLCSLQRTRCVGYWLAVAQDVLVLHTLVSLLREKQELWSCKLFFCQFLVTHLPHLFVAVVSEVQVVRCYDFIASVVIIIRICWEYKEIVTDILELEAVEWLTLVISKERNDQLMSGLSRLKYAAHLLSFLEFSFSAAKWQRNLFSLESNLTESFGTLCKSFEMYLSLRSMLPPPTQVRYNSICCAPVSKYTLKTQQQPVLPHTTADNLTVWIFR